MSVFNKNSSFFLQLVIAIQINIHRMGTHTWSKCAIMNTDSFNFMQEIFNTVLKNSLDLFAYIDKNQKYQYVSNSYAQFYGHKAQSLINKSPQDIFEPVTYEDKIRPNLNKCLTSALPINYKSWVRPKGTNEESFLYITYLPHFSEEHQEVVGIIVIAKDVTKFKRAETLLAKSANTDALTNIPNRLFLTNKLNELSQNANRHTDRYAILFCDLDGFKSVNDKYGHAVGDRILSQVAQRLKHEIREEDIIARYGGDEFVILITDRASLVTINAIRNKIFSAISQPFQFSGDNINIGISIGSAIYPDHGTEPDDLLIKADAEMYSSKNS